MTKLFINDLSECKALDKEALHSVRGGNSYYGRYPVNIGEILGKYLDSVPGYPMPHTPYDPDEPIPFGGPGPADGPL